MGGGIREGLPDGWKVRNNYLRIKKWDGFILPRGIEQYRDLAERNVYKEKKEVNLR